MNSALSLTEKDIRKAATRVLAKGKYRIVYDAPSLGAVVKVPKDYTPQPGDEKWADPLEHARKEIATLNEIHMNPAFLHLRRYTPHVFFSNPETGIIVMRRYRRGKPTRKHAAEERVISRMFRDTLRMFTADYGLQNLMRDEAGNAVLVDFGY